MWLMFDRKTFYPPSTFCPRSVEEGHVSMYGIQIYEQKWKLVAVALNKNNYFWKKLF